MQELDPALRNGVFYDPFEAAASTSSHVVPDEGQRQRRRMKPAPPRSRRDKAVAAVIYDLRQLLKDSASGIAKID